MRFQCPECKAINAVAEDKFGQDVQCKTCSKTIKAPADTFSPGSLIGDFAIIKEIAKGGMGIVYLAQQLSLDRPAALKILQPHLCNDKTLVDSLIQEARLAAKLNHPNIVQAYAVGNDQDTIYFAMEYVDGPTMKAVLAQEKVLDFKRAANIISQIADALNFAWTERKLTHRDIKPDNIIIASNGRAKLADLGLSQIGTKSNVTDTGEVLGTPQYISPEQLTGAEIDCRSDIYSLGATLYQFVTGRYAYIGENTDEIAKQHVTGNLTPPKEVNPALPSMLNDIIVKMMALYPANRYQNAKEVRIALDKYIAVADTLNAASAPAAAGAAPAISIIKLKTKPSTTARKNPNGEEEEAAEAAPEAAVPKAAAPKAAAPKAAAPKAGALKKAVPKAAAPKAAIAKPAAVQDVAKPDAVPVIKGIAPAASRQDAKTKKKNIRLIVLAALLVIVAAAAMIVTFSTPEEAVEESLPVIAEARFALEAKELAAMAPNIPDQDFLNRCDAYFLRTNIPRNAAHADLQAYQRVRDLYGEKEEAVRAGIKRQELLMSRTERAADAVAAKKSAEEAEKERLRLRAENEKEMAVRQREQEKISAAYMKELRSEMSTAMNYYFMAIAEADPSVFSDNTRGMAIFDPDYTRLSRKDAETAVPMLTQAQQMQSSLNDNLADINRFNIAKDYIIGVQFPWKVVDNNGKETEFLFRVDDFNAETLQVTDLYTDVKHSLNLGGMSPEALKGIDAAIDRKALAQKSKKENVVFPPDHPRQHFLFFNLMHQKQYAPWMKEIAPNEVWIRILDGVMKYKAGK